MMLLQSVVAKPHFAQKRCEASGFAVLKRCQNAFVKEVHYGLRQAKTDLHPFLTISGTRQRAIEQ
jgi:hypothetical protein